jgi:hypothetical protein
MDASSLRFPSPRVVQGYRTKDRAKRVTRVDSSDHNHLHNRISAMRVPGDDLQPSLSTVSRGSAGQPPLCYRALQNVEECHTLLCHSPRMLRSTDWSVTAL